MCVVTFLRRAALVEYVMRSLNSMTFGKGGSLRRGAVAKLVSVAGPSRARALMDLMDHGDCMNSELRTKVFLLESFFHPSSLG